MAILRACIGLILTAAAVCASSPTGRIFFLDLKGGRLLSANTDGTDVQVLLRDHRTGVDGIVVDAQAGHIFWTNMGKVSVDLELSVPVALALMRAHAYGTGVTVDDVAEELLDGNLRARDLETGEEEEAG